LNCTCVQNVHYEVVVLHFATRRDSLLSVPQIQSQNVPCLKQEVTVTTDGFYCIIYKYIVLFDEQVKTYKEISRLEVVTTVLPKIFLSSEV